MSSSLAIKKPIKNGHAKVPVIMQMEELECGAACLDMVLAYYNKWVPIEVVRRECGISRDGSRAGNIARAARRFGLNAKGYTCEAETLRDHGQFPCIIHWDFKHFLVCNGFKGNKVYLNDPAKGDYTVSFETFDEAFTGVVIMLSPSEDFVADGKPKSMLLYAKSRLNGMTAAFIVMIACIAILATVEVIYSAYTRVFLDIMLPGLENKWMFSFFAGLTIIVLIKIITTGIKEFFTYKIQGKLVISANAAYMWKVMSLPMNFYYQRQAADIQLRKTTNSEIVTGLVDNLAPVIINIIMMILFLIVMFTYSWVLALISIIVVALKFLITRYISYRRLNITRVLMRERAKLSATTTSSNEMIETIKASGAENGSFMRWTGYQASTTLQNVRNQKLDAYLGLIPTLLTGLLNSVILIIGIWLILQGSFTAGAIMAFKDILSNFMAPVQALIDSGQVIQEMRSKMERVDDVMEYPNDKLLAQYDVPETKEEYVKLSGNVELKNVSFGYSELEEPLIKDFSLVIESGQRIAFVGDSGCGKSTMTKLITGLYQPWSGEITFDGKNLLDIDRNVFTSSIAVVEQDITLFEDTISNNIKMWDDTIEDFEVILAARDAAIHDDIVSRPGGYNYKLSEGGKDFSGGQRQRMEIARALVQDPAIIIMDEATSALDARTEYDVVNAISRRGITCIIIAHRLSTIRDCDKIIVFEHGKVVEQGTHDELMANNGLYKTLVTSDD